MKNLVVLICGLILCITLLSCHSKQTPITRLSDIVEDLQQNASEYSEEDWQYFAEEFESIEAEIEQYRYDYTAEELNEIGRLKGICIAQLTKYSLNALKNEFDNSVNELNGLVEGLKQGFEDIKME